jgi:nucleotide-binding universal stress UspA family protein
MALLSREREKMAGIVVGIDGSEHSRRALVWAAQEAALRQVPLIAVHAYDPAPGYWIAPVPYVEEDPALTKKALEVAQQEVDSTLAALDPGSRPPVVTVRAVAGSPASTILEAADDADLIVVGSRGSGGFHRLMLGSVGTQVVHHAHRPVVVIPADAD